MITAKAALAISAILLSSFAAAQEPDEATKTWALKRAYQLNGNSMVGWSMVDLSTASGEAQRSGMPVIDPQQKNEIDALADGAPIIPRHVGRGVCAMHHMKKVYTADGSSWRCRK